MKLRCSAVFLALAVSAATGTVGLGQTYVWDVSTDPGYQNASGTWGTDSFWTVQTGTGSGTTLTAWSSGRDAWLGGNSTVAATPAGDFIITVNATQQANTVRQIQNGAGNFTLQGGSLEVLGFRVDRDAMTVNSVILTAPAAGNPNNWMALTAITGTSTLILGGNNTFTNIARIGGNAGGGGKVLLNHQNALGLGTEVLFGNGSNLDLNGYSISGKSISVTDTRTGILVNSGTAAVEWSGSVLLPNASAVGFRAGGTGGEVEISGVISGISGNTVQSLDNGTLRLSGSNTYDGDTSVRPGSTMIVNNASALGSTVGLTFINTSATLDLNGFNVGNEAVTLQTTTSSLLNNNASAAATVGGNILISQSTGTIGGPGDLSLGGVISSTTTGGFSKTGAGSLTLSGNNTYTGATAVDAGALVVNGDQSAAIGAVTVSSTATLGGTGTLGGATAVSGILAPGSGGIGTLTVANDVTWNGGQSWLFELGAAGASIGSPGTSDLLSISGNNDFLMGTGSTWTFDFGGSSTLGWYKLADWTGGTSTFTAGDFTATNLGGNNTGEFAISGNALYIQVVPEPASWALAAAGVAGAAWVLGRRRHTRRAA